MTSPPLPSALGVDDVCVLLQNAGLHYNYTAAVRENAIDGSALLLLNEEDLRGELGVTALGDRKKLANLITGLRDIEKDQSGISASPNSSLIGAPLSTAVNSTPMSMAAFSSAPSSPPSLFSISPLAAPSHVPSVTTATKSDSRMVEETPNANDILEDILGSTKMIDEFTKAVRGQLSRDGSKDTAVIHPPVRRRSLIPAPSRDSWLPFGKDKPYFSEIPKATNLNKEDVDVCYDDIQVVESELEGWGKWALEKSPEDSITPTSAEEEHEEFWPSVSANAETQKNVPPILESKPSGKSWSSVVARKDVKSNAQNVKVPAPAAKKNEKAENNAPKSTQAQQQPKAPTQQPKAGKNVKKVENSNHTQQKKSDVSSQPQNQPQTQKDEKNDKAKKNAAKANDKGKETKKAKQPEEESWTTVTANRDAPKSAKGPKLPSQVYLTAPYVVWIGRLGDFDQPTQPSLAQGTRLIREELSKMCTPLGAVSDIAVIESLRVPETVGSAFVTFATASGALRAISELQGQKLPGMRSCSLRVEVPGNKWIRQCFKQFGRV